MRILFANIFQRLSGANLAGLNLQEPTPAAGSLMPESLEKGADS